MSSCKQKNKGINPKLFYEIIKLNEECFFHNHVNLHVIELGPGQAKIETHIEKKHMNPFNIVHGGVLFSIGDTAMGVAIRTMNLSSVTIDCQINYLKPANKGDIIIGKGQVVKVGRKIIVAQSEILNSKGQKLAILTGTFYNTGKVMEIE